MLRTDSVPFIPGIVLRLDPMLDRRFVPDPLLNNRLLLRRMRDSLDRRLGLRRCSGPGWSLGLGGGLRHRGIEGVQRFLGCRLQAGHERFLVQALFLSKGFAARDHTVLDGAQAAVLLGDQLGPGLGGLQLAVQPAVLMLEVGKLSLHLRSASDLLLEGEHLDGMSAVLAMPGGLDAPESV